VVKKNIILQIGLGNEEVTRLSKPALNKFLDRVSDHLKALPRIVKLPKKETVFVGDTHGDFRSSIRVIEKYLSKDRVIVFLGDYVDRAPEPFGDIRNILYLFSIMLENNNVILLRGNHEDFIVNSKYGFEENMEACFSYKLWRKINDVFALLPLVALTKDVIALHGGLPQARNFKEIEEVPRGLFTGQNKVQDQILWNDSVNLPGKIIEEQHRGCKYAISYGEEYFQAAMKKLKREVLIRGHDSHAKGFMYDRRCVTVHTSTLYAEDPVDANYCDEPIKGCFVAIVPVKFEGEVSIEDIYGKL
jgi:hypothetical protein